MVLPVSLPLCVIGLVDGLGRGGVVGLRGSLFSAATGDTLTFHDPIPVLIIALHGHAATAIGDHRAHLFHGHNILQKGYTAYIVAETQTCMPKLPSIINPRHMFAVCLSAGVMTMERPT